MPAKQTGSPMTYLHDGKQYIVLAVSGGQRRRTDRLRLANTRVKQTTNEVR